MDIFWAKGFRATSMLDLAEATGVQRGSLYNAYGDKEEIFMRVFENYLRRFIDEARVALDKPDLRAALTAFFDLSIRTITRGSPARGCLSTKVALELDQETPRQREALRKLIDMLNSVVCAALDTIEARAQLAIPPRQAAEVIVTMTRGIAVMERIYSDAERLKQSTAALVEMLVRKG